MFQFVFIYVVCQAEVQAHKKQKTSETDASTPVAQADPLVQSLQQRLEEVEAEASRQQLRGGEEIQQERLLAQRSALECKSALEEYHACGSTVIQLQEKFRLLIAKHENENTRVSEYEQLATFEGNHVEHVRSQLCVAQTEMAECMRQRDVHEAIGFVVSQPITFHFILVVCAFHSVTTHKFESSRLNLFSVASHLHFLGTRRLLPESRSTLRK